MTPKQTNYATLAGTMIKNLEKRGFIASYAPTGADALEIIRSLLPKGASCANGGSMSLAEIGFNNLVTNGDYRYLDRFAAKTQEEKDDVFSKIAVCDYYFMSTNAITTDGVLVNIDGIGNRVASLCFGPKHVVIVCGMNKVCPDLDSAYQRVKLEAAPPNCVRLSRNTPCAATGECHDCLSPDCICSHIVYTRRPNVPNRIHVILVGEELGY